MSLRDDIEKAATSEKRGGMVNDSKFRGSGPSSHDDPDEHGDGEVNPDDDDLMLKKAGEDVLDAHKSGDPVRVAKAHMHMLHVHMRGLAKDEPEGDESDESPRLDFAERIKAAKER